MEKHKNELLNKSGMDESSFNGLLQLILKKVRIVPNEVTHPYREEALEIVRQIDPDDAIFIACALAYPNSIIGSDDKKLKNQAKIKVINTQKIIEIL